MGLNRLSSDIPSYLKELTIVTIGVLIALVISNLQETYQSKKYQAASTEAVKKEIFLNSDKLKVAIERHTALRDTVAKYCMDRVLLSDLIFKADGLHGSYLRNTGLEFYSRNEIGLIDFKMMTMLMDIKSTSNLIDTKMEKLMDFIYPNLFVDTEDSKKLVILHINNLLNSETQLMFHYENLIDDYNKTADKNTS